jgi:hypothetical protein
LQKDFGLIGKHLFTIKVLTPLSFSMRGLYKDKSNGGLTPAQKAYLFL